ncbi:MAG: hypothetical protein JNK41_01970 [Saprospiraceae bacterium]|nr:hypothetical protein [Saprospiraceae bacterium]
MAFLLAKFLPLNGLSTANIAIIMGFGAMAWIGVSMVSLIPNPSGPEFKMWKMLFNGVFGFMALIGVLVLGITDTDTRVKKELKEYGVIANAVVVNKDYTTLPAKRGKVNYVYYLTVQFQDQNGAQQQVKCEVGEYDYANAGSSGILKINYSSRNPNINRLIFR